MLMLTRGIGETIVIGGNITIVIDSIRGHDVRIGVDAPRDISIYRGEIQDKIDKGNGDGKSDKREI
jgi:carbon storage regulator